MFEKVFISIVPLNEGYCIEKTRITSENSELNVSKRLEREVHIDEQVAVVAAQVFAEQSNCQFIGSGSILAIQVPVGERPFVVKATSAGGLVIEPVASIGSLIEAFSETSVSGKGDSSGPAIAGEPIENDKQQNLQDYVSYLSEEVVPTLHVPFNLVIDHHLSWDTEGSWRAYFKNLYSKLPPREANLLHASIKIIVCQHITENVLLEMIKDKKNDWTIASSALEIVINEAKACDPDYDQYQLEHSNLQDYVSYLSEEVVPTLHVPFDLVIDHHLSWDTEGSWRAYFKNLYSKLPQREANLLHASIKILTKPEGNRDGEDKLQNMIVNSDKDILKNLKEALLFVIKTASSCDNEYRDLR